MVAGVAGLILSINPHLTARQVREILQTTADKIVDSNPDPQLGLSYGSYNGQGHSQWFGYGKVNAFAAVQAAQGRALTRRLTQTVKVEQVTPVAIADYPAKAIDSTLGVNQSGTLVDIQVQVQIDHDFLGDLSLTLVAPRGVEVLIQGRTLGGQRELRQRYSFATTPVLINLLGQSVQGDWRLRAIDHAPGATGQILSWSLTLGLG